MTSIWLPGLVALAAITAVYLSCVRPPPSPAWPPPDTDP